MDILKKIIDKRGIRRVFYFHTDHFEPIDLNGKNLVEKRVIDRFIKRSSQSSYGDRLSLFVRPAFGVGVGDEKVSGQKYSCDGDKVFFYRTPQMDLLEEYIRLISERTNHEMQLHLHHEHFTSSDSTLPKVREFLDNDRFKKMEHKRFSLYLKLSLEYMRSATKQPFKDWFFVHGKWALNAADRRVCTLNGEIEVLMRHGCKGDFTFPAGRKYCDPYIKFPFTFVPEKIDRCYDYIGSRPKAVDMGRGGFDGERFFVWNSKLQHPSSSLDYFSPQVNEILNDSSKFIPRLLSDSPVIGEDLYIKTYAHTLSEKFVNDKNLLFPFEHRGFVKSMNLLRNECSKLGVEFCIITASEVFKNYKAYSEEAGRKGI